jgi:hypothetical protein
MSDTLDLAALAALHEAATPAPWPEDFCQAAVRQLSKNVDYDVFYDGDFCGWDRYTDGPLIAAARNALPALLARAKAAERMGAALREIPNETKLARIREICRKALEQP